MAGEEFEKPRYYGLGLRIRIDLMGDYRLNEEGNRDRIHLRNWPEETQIVNLCPRELERLLLRRKSAKLSDPKIAEFLAQNFAAGIILVQVALAPPEDITEATQEAYKNKLYTPINVQKRNFWIRCWSKYCSVDFERPPEDTESRYGPPHKFPIGDNIVVHNGQGTIVSPDIMLNRELTIADRQGFFTVLGTHQMYPLPLGQYEFEITWDGIKIVKDFSACQEMVAETLRVGMLNEIDPEAAALLYGQLERRRFSHD